MRRDPARVGFHVALLLTGAAALTIAFRSTGAVPPPAGFLIVSFLACATAPLRIHLPGVERSVSLSLVFRFTAVTELPVGYAFLVVCVAVLYESVLDGEMPPWRELPLALASIIVYVFPAASVYDLLTGRWQLAPLVCRGAAAFVYYAAYTTTAALRLALETGGRPEEIWKKRFFWTGPLYILAPIPGEIARMLHEDFLAPDRLLALALTFAGYRYIKLYFSRLHDEQDHATRLDDVRQRTIEALAVAIEMKDGCTAGHLGRVRRHSVQLAKRMGCSDDEVKTLELAAVLHDIGKVVVPDYILGKPDRLTEYEFNQMVVHTTAGADIVSTIRFPYPVEEIVRSHHEHWDGSGYPRQLLGTQIPRLARILTVVDCFDALVSDRPYRAALPVEKAVEIMRKQRGKLFDPEILDAFIAEVPGFVEALRADLEADRVHLKLKRSAAPRFRQTWFTDAEENSAGLQQAALRQLASSPDRLLLLYEILQVLGADLDVGESLRKVLAMLQRLSPYARAGIFLRTGETCTLLTGLGFPDHCTSRLSFPLEHGAVAHAATSRRPIAADGPPAELPNGCTPKYMEDVRSSLVAPLFEDDRLVGVLTLCATAPGRYDPDQAWFLSLITGKLAATLSSAISLEKLRLDATTDPLTRLPNSRASFERLKAELARASRERSTVAVMFVDLNGFKPINDIHGHAVGDKLLIATAETLTRCLRPYDLLGRIGGDEFLIIMPGIPKESVASRVMSLKKALAHRPLPIGDGVEIAGSASFGVALYPDDGVDADELVMLSDKRMYQDKRSAEGEEAGKRKSAPGGLGVKVYTEDNGVGDHGSNRQQHEEICNEQKTFP